MTDFADIEARLSRLENRVTSLESNFSMIELSISNFGDYKNRTREELNLMKGQFSMLVDTLESMLNKTISDDDAVRAKALKRRLKNNQTRVQKALEESK
ncbi:hypothetical protein VXS05_04290 [Photobacterium toruni]|uniref:hypothetical protein n=1 Tax=Photobacterium toruni TaxID=1935446 RepID=UPI002E19A019|nr:hypothetical protein [Photobacterium toruni]